MLDTGRAGTGLAAPSGITRPKTSVKCRKAPEESLPLVKLNFQHSNSAMQLGCCLRQIGTLNIIKSYDFTRPHKPHEGLMNGL